MSLARLCARLKPVFLSKKRPSKARLFKKISPSEELGTLVSPVAMFHPLPILIPNRQLAVPSVVALPPIQTPRFTSLDAHAKKTSTSHSCQKR